MKTISTIFSHGKVVGADADAMTITVQIQTRPSGVKIGDECELAYKVHDHPDHPDLLCTETVAAPPNVES